MIFAKAGNIAKISGGQTDCRSILTDFSWHAATHTCVHNVRGTWRLDSHFFHPSRSLKKQEVQVSTPPIHSLQSAKGTHARSTPGFAAPARIFLLISPRACIAIQADVLSPSLVYTSILSKAGIVTQTLWKANRDVPTSSFMLHHHYAERVWSATPSREAEDTQRCNSSLIYHHTCDALFLSNQDARRGY